ncbi:uncharacterized protein LOC131942772 [Physella acuta]|uniref:uncharacterized protein LOC131942772 n=1 Tax=Physella acuta TaxID=109671 RepID=UPI0027DAC28B|nr:uncharacterized protein LOC131942772 [Physella acuta]
MYPHMNQWNASQYPQNLTRQPYNNQTNVWSTNQTNMMITQQPLSLTSQPTYYGQPPVFDTNQDVMRTESYGCYIAISILTIVFCCLPFGIIGLRLSINACILYRDRQFVDAQNSAKTACRFNISAFVMGVILYCSMLVWYFRYR